MSTLNITPRFDGDAADVHGTEGLRARFDALVRAAEQDVDARSTAPAEFGTVFDLEYGERRLATVRPQSFRSRCRSSAPPPRTCARLRPVRGRRPCPRGPRGCG